MWHPRLLILPLIGNLLVANHSSGDEELRLRAPTAQVYTAPDETSCIVGEVGQSTRLVRRESGDSASGWLVIAAPPGLFDWVDSQAIERTGTGTGTGMGRIRVDRAIIRAGIPNAKMPGPPVADLRRGAEVTLLDRDRLSLPQGSETRIWVAIMPPADRRYYLRRDDLEDVGPGANPSTATNNHEPPSTLARDLPSTGDRVSPGESDPQPSQPSQPTPNAGGRFPELAAIEARHWAILAMPMEHWELADVRRLYQERSRLASDSAEIALIEKRLGEVTRQEVLGDSARRFQEALAKSRAHDRAADLALKRTRSQPSVTPRRTYDAEGLLQVSAKRALGQAVLSLVGDEGLPIGYVIPPPGMEFSRVIGRRVGVRGRIRFDEDFQARLIEASEIDPIDKSP